MHRFIAGFPTVLALGVLTAAGGMAHADPAPAAKAASTTSEPTQAKTTESSTRIVCLNVSLQCFRVASSATGTNGPAKSLDLRAPDIRTLVSEAELRQRVDEEWAISEREDEQQVRVEGARPDIYVPGGFAALGWAAIHPTQAWRIFLPVPASQTK